ncbi:PAS-domain containing protein [uncultured Roseobacter sp.]|uniref:PAS-domain containing protein n=1 Tax=uncultured Roseobacter sp. TaxID=114847 RepID=UPI00263745DB|nr:PAS-domain containing protein [uncultured Roseobacter sp.]
MTVWDIAVIASAAIVSTLAGLAWVISPRAQTLMKRRNMTQKLSEGVSFLFDGDRLHHASDAALQVYHPVPGEDDWSAWRARMAGRFPDLPLNPDDSNSANLTVQARNPEDKATLCVSRKGRFTQVQMIENGMPAAIQSQQLRALSQELENLRRASDTTPHAIWQINHEGRVTWYNAAYERLYSRLHNEKPREDQPVFEVSAVGATGNPQRVSTKSSQNGTPDWYDVSTARVGDTSIYHAVNINAVVRSEAAQRNFVQTLAKTFAQLSIGLAIFDRNGQLALFNPALIDLTGLPADFLSGRPTLLSFFDRMRENRRMPEPKDYGTWRQQIAEVIAAATDGRYQETWTLETGQTYRVRGRPHPDGAIAFLIEDISAEVSLTRNFRAELELGQSLMDTFEEALVVFSSTGVLTFCNVAYRTLWGLDPDSSFADVTIADSVREWKTLTESGARWAALTDFVLEFGDRESWEMPVTLTSGDRLTCTVSRIASGATVIRFIAAEKKAPRRRLPAKTENFSTPDP